MENGAENVSESVYVATNGTHKINGASATSTQASSLKNIIITGGAGYIGSHTVLSLILTRKYRVASIDNFHNAYPASLDRVQEIARQNLPENPTDDDILSTQVQSFKADLTKEDQVRSVVSSFGHGGLWGVIHIAAYKAVGESNEIPLAYYENNVSATLLLAKVMEEYGCHRLVYSSSATVYGIPPIVPIPEITKLDAMSPYGRSKVMSETILSDLCRSKPDTWKVISLRYFNPAGAHPSGLIGEEPRGRPGNLLPLLAHMAVGRIKEATLKVFGNDYPTPDGACVRDYLHICDLADGHLLALEALEDGSTVFDHPDGVGIGPKEGEGKYRAFNLGKGQGLSVFNIVDAMRKATGFDFQTVIVGRRAGDVPDLTADPTLARKILGFEAKHDLESMCRDLWNWQTKNPEGYTTTQ
ncbi:UDP-glucose 4-epimerase; AltName: Full=Galactowaldenase; AltName: Full=UDP-galactose 4-epimerase [Serendipita indica DSM 11827]|uniref:Related to GAL10-UDP-glucose 4-epimerase n=1 Tax=Serendipita indica (strain DSM 11827) TaxID=1109443 RepID=G4TA87_SERID|nr:UDP-glucose 4-epimerase; AltName: Full=Galactowaldenase; AltName: Full=UDP-galactose 4-epimerase [Serendipita indica DSM 11827]CCA68238.1 related to GAL10-UDP-glucose 4-epimerase [Serendipita indica DSM 11827]